MRRVDISKDVIELEGLIDEVTKSNQPIAISGNGVSAILISQAHWSGIQETLHLLKIPGMHDSIRKAMAEPLIQSKSPTRC
jgi:PHD/YefM family antitoxin component YafN of YafNO toxin-antitoxin module